MDFIWFKFYESCYFYSNKFSHRDFLISWRIDLAYIHDRKLQVGWQRWRGRSHWASHLESRGDRCGDQWGHWHLSSRQASGWLGRLGRWWMLRGDDLQQLQRQHGGLKQNFLGFFASKMGVQYGLTNKSRVQNQPWWDIYILYILWYISSQQYDLVEVE